MTGMVFVYDHLFQFLLLSAIKHPPCHCYSNTVFIIMKHPPFHFFTNNVFIIMVKSIHNMVKTGGNTDIHIFIPSY